MGYTNHEQPNTSYYDSDLKELILMYEKVKGDYDGLDEQMTALSEKVDDLYNYVDEEIANGLAETIENVNQNLALVQSNINALEVYVQNFEQYVNDRFISERELTDTKIDAEITALALSTLAMVQYLQEQIDDIQTRLAPIYNPTTAKTESIEKTVNDVFQLSRYHALTCAEYDGLKLSALSFDDLQLSANEFAMDSEQLAKPELVVNVFNGIKTTVQNMMSWLSTYYNSNTVTSAYYDALQLTADDFTALDFTANEYDFNAGILI